MAQVKAKQAGRVAVRIAEDLKSRIAAGDLQIGQYLPGVREVSRAHNVSPETARRAMKIMEAENWVRSHPGHGFKITAKGNDPASAAPVAFILSGLLADGEWSPLGQHLLGSMYRAAERRGWSLLGVNATGRSNGEIVDELKAARTSGLLIDTPNEKLTRTLTGLGVPTVLVEERSAGLDSVTQDNFYGAFRAAEYLIERGHRRLGWFGSKEPTLHSRERWAGAMAAVRDSEAEIVVDGGMRTESITSNEEIECLRDALKGNGRISGVLTLWWNAAVTAAKVVRDAGLEPGRDVEIVSWCPREQLAEFKAAYPGRFLPPTMVWSIGELGEAALGRLAERRQRPDAPAVRVSVEVELLPGGEEEPK